MGSLARKAAEKVAERASMSFHDLMEAVGKGHRMLADQPGARTIPKEMREIRPGEQAMDVLKRYEREGLLVDRQGRPLKAKVGAAPTPAQTRDQAMADMERGRLPRKGSVGFYDDSGMYVGAIDFRGKGLDVIDDAGQVGMYNRLRRAQAPGEAPTRMYALDTTEMPTGLGKAGYSAMWDALRADKAMNTIDNLTGINQMRRPGNLMSYGTAHGDYDYTPLFSTSSIDPKPFGPSGYGGAQRYDVEGNILNRHVMERAGRETMNALDGPDIWRYSPDAQTGLLALKELQMAKSHGSMNPDVLGAPYGEQWVYKAAHPMDVDALKWYAQKAREEGTGGRLGANRSRYDPAEGFGPHIMGRVGTTEALLGGVQHGASPEEVVQELLRYRGATDALKGRYKKGGLVRAAIES